MNDLASRRGQIVGMEHRNGSQVIRAMVPLAEMFGYANDMRFWTQGRAQYSMQFVQYEEAPQRMDPGGEPIGVTANKPKRPAPRSGRAAANANEESA
jgi:translation elongation factor EF-G